jgi:hypothetical protein
LVFGEKEEKKGFREAPKRGKDDWLVKITWEEMVG